MSDLLRPGVLPVIAVLAPWVGSALIWRAGASSPRARVSIAVGSTLVVLAAVSDALYLRLGLGVPVEAVYGITRAGSQLTLGLRLAAQPLGLVLAIVAAALWVLTTIYSVGYMAHEHAQNRYFTYLIMVEGAAMGIVFAADLLTFFVFYELLTLMVYPLVVHEESRAAIVAGRTYLIYLLVGETLVFAALLVVVAAAGFVPSFAAGGLATGIGLFGARALAVTALGFVGFSAKAAVMPLHGWLPDAMIAPTPVSAVLHAVAVVNVGVLGVFTLLYLVIGAHLGRSLGLNVWLPWVAAATIIGASLIAMRQDEIKRRLAYSTISQLGYMVLGASLLTAAGLRAAVLHMFAHSLMKIVLFFCAGLIITQTGKRYFSEIGGLARRMPITMACFTVGAAGMVGLPPAVGWISKWTLLAGTLSSGQGLLAAVIILSAFLNLAYYFPPIMSAYFGSAPEDEPQRPRGLEAPLSMLVPTVAITIAVLVFGIWVQFPYWLANQAVMSVLGRGG